MARLARFLLPLLLLASCECAGGAIGDSRDTGHGQGGRPDADDGIIVLGQDGGTTGFDAGPCGNPADLEGCACNAPGTGRPCYTGPAGTRGVGLCEDGTQPCVANGEFGAWGKCQGQTLPAAQDCRDGNRDQDCDGLKGCNDPDCAKDPVCLPGGPCSNPDDLSGCPCSVLGTERACYSGPAGTRGKGRCSDGSQSCVANGEIDSWGPCTGEVVPAAEACQNGIDDDCDGTTDCQDPDCRTAAGCVPECTAGAVAPCYTGPSGTSGVGVCKPGKKTCGADGKWGSACAGEVKPGSEGFFDGNCKDGLDNDCNGLTDCDELGCLFDSGCAPQVCTAGQTRACYTGPSGTSGHGPCHDGTEACASDGKSWGACTGQVLPGIETCTDGVDNNCNGLIDCADLACFTAKECCTPNTGTVDMTIWAHSSDELYLVDPTTFATTLVGSFNVGDQMTDLAVTPAGVLYAISFSALYRVDKTTAQATYVAPLSGSANNGLTFLADGTLLASDGTGEVKRIDPASGALTSVGFFGNGLSSSGDLVAVQGVMYGISSTAAGGADASGNNILLRVDTATGVAAVVGPIGFGNVWGLAYVKGRVIAFSNTGQIIQVDPQTGQGTLLATKNVAFWGAGQSPLTPVNPCP